MPDAKAAVSSSRSAHTEYEYIEHYVSKLDTLPGVAIKYGVEVADVKRFNGLATDSQMYAHKVLRIPLHGKHLPSTALVNPSSSGSSSPRRGVVGSANRHEPKFKERRSTSAAMELLRGYYGLSIMSEQSADNSTVLELIEGEDDVPFSPIERPPLIGSGINSVTPNGLHNKGEVDGRTAPSASRQSNGHAFSKEDVNQDQHILLSGATPTSSIGDSNNERSVRRRFKGDSGNSPLGPELEGKQDFNVPDKPESSLGLLSIGSEVSGVSVLPATMLKASDGTSKHKESAMSKVRKSSSTSSLQDQPSLPVNLGIHKLVSKVEEKLVSSLTLTQAGARGFSDMPPKPTYRFKTALD